MSYAKEAVIELAERIKKEGFRVFIAECGTYGFYTDQAGSKVVSFQFGVGGFTFAGNYKSSPLRGTGWGLPDSSDFQFMFDQYPPLWAVGRSEWTFTTLEQHLKTYQQSSKYTEF